MSREYERKEQTTSHGSTLLWVEAYGAPVSQGSAALGIIRGLLFGAAVTFLAHGAAFFVGMQRFH